MASVPSPAPAPGAHGGNHAESPGAPHGAPPAVPPLLPFDLHVKLRVEPADGLTHPTFRRVCWRSGSVLPLYAVHELVAGLCRSDSCSVSTKSVASTLAVGTAGASASELTWTPITTDEDWRAAVMACAVAPAATAVSSSPGSIRAAPLRLRVQPDVTIVAGGAPRPSPLSPPAASSTRASPPPKPRAAPAGATSGAPPTWPTLSSNIIDMKPHYDVVVIGSGYGGAIAACRLARAGRSVCVLERGKEMWPGAYPNTLPEMIANLQIRSGVWPYSFGSADALHDIRVEDGAAVWIGCGLGGGSLINSNVAIEPDSRVYDDPAWPPEIKADVPTLLKDGFSRATAMLQPSQYPDQAATPLAKAAFMQRTAAALKAASSVAEVAEAIHGGGTRPTAAAGTGVGAGAACATCGSSDAKGGASPTADSASTTTAHAAGAATPTTSHAGAASSFPRTSVKFGFANVNVSFAAHTNPAGVAQPACALCGDCNTGCNYGSKNTVLMNYLPDAHTHGAEVYCQTQVRHLSVDAAGKLWTVNAQYIGDMPMPVTVTADIVVLGAGSLGSTEIMLRSREMGLAMSPQVGLHFGGDGDLFGWCYNGDTPLNNLGYGDMDVPTGRKTAGVVGPCITSVVDLRDPTKPPRDGMILEDIGFPGALVSTLNLVMPTLEPWLGTPTDKDPKHLAEAAARKAKSLAPPSQGGGPYVLGGATRNAIILGGMSFDDQAGHMSLEEDNLRVHWKTSTVLPSPARVNALETCAAAMPTENAVQIKDPLTTALGSRATVHPLGGCVMGTDASTGAVNHKGQYFSGASGTAVYPGLYCFDGASIPTSIGVNPLLTISAIAERATYLMAADRGWRVDYGPRGASDGTGCSEACHLGASRRARGAGTGATVGRGGAEATGAGAGAGGAASSLSW